MLFYHFFSWDTYQNLLLKKPSLTFLLYEINCKSAIWQNFFTSKLCYHPQKLTFKWDKYSDIIVMESFFCYWNFWRKLTSINSLETIKHGEFCFPSCCWLTLLSKYRMFWLTIILWFYNHVCLQHKVLKINNEKY